MRYWAIACACAGILVSMHTASGSVDLAITLINDGIDEITVTVYDMSTQPSSTLLSGYVVNGFAAVPISIGAGADGGGHVVWTAATVDPRDRRCGQGDRSELTDGDAVHLVARRSCTQS